jgi:hypothetical protein
MIKFTEGLGTRGRVWLIYGKKAGGAEQRLSRRRRRQQSGTETEEGGSRAERRLKQAAAERNGGLSDEGTRTRAERTRRKVELRGMTGLQRKVARARLRHVKNTKRSLRIQVRLSELLSQTSMTASHIESDERLLLTLTVSRQCQTRCRVVSVRPGDSATNIE